MEGGFNFCILVSQYGPNLLCFLSSGVLMSLTSLHSYSSSFIASEGSLSLAIKMPWTCPCRALPDHGTCIGFFWTQWNNVFRWRGVKGIHLNNDCHYFLNKCHSDLWNPLLAPFLSSSSTAHNSLGLNGFLYCSRHVVFLLMLLQQ